MKMICEKVKSGECKHGSCNKYDAHEQTDGCEKHSPCPRGGDSSFRCVPVEPNKPYFAEAQVGDKVMTAAMGDGAIKSITKSIYPIKVVFEGCDFESAFTVDGKFDIDDIHPTLFYSGTKITIDPAPRPKRMVKKKDMYDLGFDRKGKLAWVELRGHKVWTAPAGCIVIMQKIYLVETHTHEYEVEEGDK